VNRRDLLALSSERDKWQARLTAAQRDAYRQGWQACLDRFADLTGGRVWPAHPTEIELRRYFVLCPACRRTGGQAGCGQCRPGPRRSFGQPVPGDYPGACEQVRA
jgi:hypothetical protein